MTYRIMLVDDEPGLTQLLQLSLEATGKFVVMAINDAASAVEAARAFLPDVMLLDVLMPKMLGNEIVPLIQEIPELKHTKFIFLTALMRKTETPAESAGAPRVLGKPVTTEELLAAIDDAMGNPACST